MTLVIMVCAPAVASFEASLRCHRLVRETSYMRYNWVFKWHNKYWVIIDSGRLNYSMATNRVAHICSMVYYQTDCCHIFHTRTRAGQHGDVLLILAVTFLNFACLPSHRYLAMEDQRPVWLLNNNVGNERKIANNSWPRMSPWLAGKLIQRQN